MSARSENVRTLASAAGIPDDQANNLLDSKIVITANADDGAQAEFAAVLKAIIERTFEHCSLDATEGAQVEIILGMSPPRLSVARVWVAVNPNNMIVGCEPVGDPFFERVSGAHQVVGACYVASFVAKRLAGDGLPHVPDPNVVDFNDLAIPPADVRVRIGAAYLAGAGAIGNAFLWTLRHFDVVGTLHIYDPDIVNEGNLNRQIYFGPDDLGLGKAAQLAMRATSDFSGLKLVPHPLSLQASPQKSNDDRWLETLVVGVDSRRARRHLQSELPKRVFDASTTGVEEVVVHFNDEPGPRACMGCIYHETPDEAARERHVADALGVNLEELQQTWISVDAARRIAARIPGIQAEEIVGEAYDSLFKTLCGQQRLNHAGNDILAPFAFVSILAGAILAIEFVKRLASEDPSKFNYWKISPWVRPLGGLKRSRQSIEHCEFCNDPIYVEVRKELWG